MKIRIGLIAGLVLLACGLPTLVPQSPSLPSPTPTWTLLPPITPDLDPVPTAQGPATAAPEISPTATLFPPAASFLCPGAPETRVTAGIVAQVTFGDGLPLRIRREPVMDPANVLGQIPEGAQFEIIGGPVCTPIPDSEAAFVFWEIHAPEPGVTGWVAEGDMETYYIEPVE